uniref:DUF7168 domain-containing protein n=1 Tax=Mycena chlorophos TaxID=658473 RepID=A0ABQ0L6A2_MYCCL|nr:predicted protein [Mycena chlorophos]
MLDPYRVKLASVLEHESDADKGKRGGRSTVAVRYVNPDSYKSLVVHDWTHTLADAMTTMFDCDYYTQGPDDGGFGPTMKWMFFGLANHTVWAAHGFEGAYNCIVKWCLNPSVGTRVHDKNCYCTGVADKLLEMAENNKKSP